MMNQHHVFAAALLALAATGFASAANAGPCIPGVGTTIVGNTCIGSGALASNSTGAANTAIGVSALQRNTTGNLNTANGSSALSFNTIGTSNTASGAQALYSNTSGNSNTAYGTYALFFNTAGFFNSASGFQSLYSNSTGAYNTATGVSALYNNSTGSTNTAVGAGALFNSITGSNNIALGYNAGVNLTTGNNNIIIGNTGAAADLNTLRIGVQGVQTRTFISGIRGTMIGSGQVVLVDANGQLGVASSSRRYKQDIQPMGNASSPLMQLHPVTFRYKQADADGNRPLQYGLIAEEVAQVMPELVIYNKDGTPESVAYQALPSLLLNEYQKQGHQLAAAQAELAETQARLAAMDGELAALKLTLKRFALASSPIQLAGR